MGATSEANRNNYTKRAARFIVALTDPDSTTFMNVEKSAVKGMDVAPATAHSQSFKLTKTESIRVNIERILEEKGMGRQARSMALIDMIQQKMSRSTKRYGPGRVLIEEVVSEPTFSDIIKAVHTLNMMDGTYTEQKKVSDEEREEHRIILKEIMREAREEAKKKKGKIIKEDESDNVKFSVEK